MKKLLAALMVFLSTSVAAVEISRYSNPADKEEYISLTNEPGDCKPEGLHRLKLVLKAFTMGGCYLLEDKTIYIVLDNGEILMIPEENFKPTKIVKK